MTYLLKVRDYYYFNRRPPEIVREYDPRKLIRVALKTDSKQEARQKAAIFNEQLEAYWQNLIDNGQTHENTSFRKTVRITRQMGFYYKPMSAVASLPIQELIERLLVLQNVNPKQVEAVLGGRPEPELNLKQALNKFWEVTKDRIIHKTPDQVRKWRNPRIKAVEGFISVIGNKDIKQISKEDILSFRDWWIERIKMEDKNPSSANKDFIHLKNVLETVSDHLKLNLDIIHLFKKIMFQTRFKQSRLPFAKEEIISILKSEKLQKMNKEGRWFLFAAAETGARPSEIVGLLPEDIRLDDDIPHICITDRKERPLKTAHSQRSIPLLGYALEAFKAMPKGFPKYRDKPDNMTNAVNKFLRENNLTSSKQHTVYSLRHSFQDRILSVNAPDRVQAELMRHKFQRPKYGSGATLEQKLEWMEKICLKR